MFIVLNHDQEIPSFVYIMEIKIISKLYWKQERGKCKFLLVMAQHFRDLAFYISIMRRCLRTVFYMHFAFFQSVLTSSADSQCNGYVYDIFTNTLQCFSNHYRCLYIFSNDRSIAIILVSFENLSLIWIHIYCRCRVKVLHLFPRNHGDWEVKVF